MWQRAKHHYASFTDEAAVHEASARRQGGEGLLPARAKTLGFPGGSSLALTETASELFHVTWRVCASSRACPWTRVLVFQCSVSLGERVYVCVCALLACLCVRVQVRAPACANLRARTPDDMVVGDDR